MQRRLDPLPLPAAVSWRFLQLVDGAFPSGGFAHSAGLEAAVRRGGLESVEPFLDQALTSAASALLPFVRAAAERPEDLPTLDAACDATLPSHVANRASRAQGRALMSAATRIFDAEPGLRSVATHAEHAPAHHAPLFGAIFGALGLSPVEAMTAYLHGFLRSILSAGVRLGLLGPLEAQRIQAQKVDLLDALLARFGATSVHDVAQTAPLLELYGALHDALPARLFQS